MLDCVATDTTSRRVDILLSHSPDAVTRMPFGSFELALSGHTHGGQIALPLVNPSLLRKWARILRSRVLSGSGRNVVCHAKESARLDIMPDSEHGRR